MVTRIIKNLYNKLEHIYRKLIGWKWKLFLAQAGENLLLHKNVRIQSPEKVKLGNNVSVNYNTLLDGHGGLEIKDNVLVGMNVLILTANHVFSQLDKPIKSQGLDCAPVVIKENSWIGANAVILPGVELGRGTVVGAGSIVTKSFPAYSVIAGNPAKLLYKRTNDTDQKDNTNKKVHENKKAHQNKDTKNNTPANEKD
jgi:maltose O-acetyltransferase